jgi:hypothetical protein
VSNKRFSEIFLRAADFAFDSLGKSCQQALYFHLKNSFHVEQENISEKIEEFDEALSLIFKEGVVYLERLILKKLCQDLGVSFEEQYVNDFVRAVSKLKSMVSEDKPSVGTVLGFNGEGVLAEKRRGGERVGPKSQHTSG